MKKIHFVIRMSMFILMTTGIIQTPLFAQKPFEGKITYKLSYENLPEEMQGFSSMMPSEMTLLIKGTKSRMEQSSFIGNTVSVTDMDIPSSFVEMDFQGQKFRTMVGPEELKEQLGSLEYEYTNESKEIAGYPCKKAIYRDSIDSFTVYYTEKFNSQIHPQFASLKGFPLEYEIEQGAMKIIVSASEILPQSLDEAIFEKSEDFREVTPEELGQLMMGGMGQDE